MEIRLEGAEFFYVEVQTDGQSDITNLIVAFPNFVNAPSKLKI